MKRTKVSIKDAGKPDGSKRYPDGKHPIYDQEYRHRLKRSAILSGTASPMDKNFFALSGGLGNMKSALAELKGGEGGYYQHDTQRLRALIPSIEQELSKIHNQYAIWQKRQVAEGKSYEKPKHWPQDLLSKRLKAESALDVYVKEKFTLENAMKELKAKEQKVHQAQLLEFGPVSEIETFKTPGNPIKSIDGQRLAKDAEGRPYIDESSSPYDGLSLYRYRQMSEKWVSKHHLKKSDHLVVTNMLRSYKKSKGEQPLGDEPAWAAELAKKYVEQYGNKFFSPSFQTLFSNGKIFQWRKNHAWPSKSEWPEPDVE